MRRIGTALVLVVVVSALGASAAMADGGPHGGYVNPVSSLAGGQVGNSVQAAATINTDACAGCHRVHVAAAGDGTLLREASVTQLCLDCHNGTGSVLDVQDGKRLSALGATGQTAAGTALNGGGFTFFKEKPVTSKHPVGTGIVQAWGSAGQAPGQLGIFDTTQSAKGSALDCASCHDPHGSKNYRLLNESIGGNPVSVLAFAPTTPSGGAPGFTNNEFGPTPPTGIGTNNPEKYTVAYYGSAGLNDSGGFRSSASFRAPAGPGDASNNGVTLLCGSCHTAYPSPDATDNTFPTAHRHRTEMAWTEGPNEGLKNSPAIPWSTTTTAVTGAGPVGTTVNSVALRLASSKTGAPSPGPQQGSAQSPNGVGDQTIVTCLTCHNAHGSSAQMTGFATPSLTTPATDTTLLVADNRAMCESCHQKATPWN